MKWVALYEFALYKCHGVFAAQTLLPIMLMQRKRELSIGIIVLVVIRVLDEFKPTPVKAAGTKTQNKMEPTNPNANKYSITNAHTIFDTLL